MSIHGNLQVLILKLLHTFPLQHDFIFSTQCCSSYRIISKQDTHTVEYQSLSLMKEEFIFLIGLVFLYDCKQVCCHFILRFIVLRHPCVDTMVSVQLVQFQFTVSSKFQHKDLWHRLRLVLIYGIVNPAHFQTRGPKVENFLHMEILLFI